MKTKNELIEVITWEICPKMQEWHSPNAIRPYTCQKCPTSHTTKYGEATQMCRLIAQNVAEAAFNALITELPNDSKDIELQARNMQIQCIKDNPTAGAVPTIYHYEQQLQHLDKSTEYYKQLLAMGK